jgi:hypothetical protein
MPRTQHRLPSSAIAVLVLARVLGAQGAGVSVHGVAYDSVRGQPLANAFVTIAGRPGSAMSDSRGRFQFDSVVPGFHTFVMQHAALDSVGISGATTRVNITDGQVEVRVAVPSFAALWRTACNTSPPRDSGFVFGTVRDDRGDKPVGGATIEITWIDVGVDEKNAIKQRRWRSQSRSDDNGSFTACGIPNSTSVRIQATTDDRASGTIDLLPHEIPIQRRDLLIGPSASASASRRGTIAGVVTDAAGAPFRDARVLMDEMPETRSGTDGRFTLRNVPAGTRQLEVLSVGMAPVVSTVDVIASDTAVVAVQLRKVTTLDAVRVTESPRHREFVREFDERKKQGFGYSADSTVLLGRGTMSAVLSGFPSTKVRSDNHGRIQAVTLGVTNSKGPPSPLGPVGCDAILWIDGVRQVDVSDLTALYPDELAVVEVYPNAMSVPPRFVQPGMRCGAVIVWTKRMLK